MKKVLPFLVLALFVSMPLFAFRSPNAPAAPPPSAPIPGIIVAILAAVSYGVYKKFNQPKN